MAIEIFRQREKEYYKWIETHRSGLVVNTQNGNRRYFTLHKSSCRSVSKSNNPWGAFTRRNYFKVCSDNIYELKEWFFAKNHKFQGRFKICKICNPDDTVVNHVPLCLFPETLEPNTKIFTEGAKKKLM